VLEAARGALRGKSSPRRAGPGSTGNAGERRRRRASTSTTQSPAPSAGADGKSGSGTAAEAPATTVTEAITKSEATTKSAKAPRKPGRQYQTKPSSEVEKSGEPEEGLVAGTLETMLGESKDGLSAIAMSRRANAGYDQVVDLLRKLESARRVRRTGSRRTSLWRVNTDEGRPAERAAEPERRSVTQQSTPRRPTPRSATDT
jgi:hypothetical protein